MAKPVKVISLYDIVTDRQPAFDQTVLSPADAAMAGVAIDEKREREQVGGAERMIDFAERASAPLGQWERGAVCPRGERPVRHSANVQTGCATCEALAVDPGRFHGHRVGRSIRQETRLFAGIQTK